MRLSLRVGAAVAAAGIAFVVMTQRQQVQPPESTPGPHIPLDGAALRGSRQAPVAVVVFSDFQCPYCAHFADTTFRELDRDYIAEGKVVFAFRHLALSHHAQAFEAASAATCAGRQGKFWEMHDRLFANAKTLKDKPWRTFAADLGLNRAQFDSCLDAEGADTVRTDLALAQAFGITGTPSFLIGRVTSDGRVRVLNSVPGALPIGAFKSVIDPLLANPPAS